MRRYLFVMGLGRSGTTALTRVLAAHHDIALGMERYKRLWDRIDELTPAHFDAQRFFDFSDGLTNLTPASSEWESYYRELEAKFPESAYVGDKMTRLLVPEVLTNFPAARFVIIVREVKALAHSWEARATDPDDHGWAASRDALTAAGIWNRSLRRTLAAATAHPDQVTVVEYASVFSDPDASSIRATLRRLDLEWDDGIASAFAAAHQDYRSVIAVKSRELPDDVRAHIEARANLRLWRRVNRLAV